MSNTINIDSADLPQLARKPRQQRSRERYARLLDATDQLLAERDTGEIGLYDVAELAEVPPASVYHFLPTKEAAFAALASRYLEELADASIRQPVPREDVRHWQDLFRISVRRSVNFFNDRPVMMKLLLSGAVSSETRARDIEYNRTLAAHGYEWMDRYFCMPFLQDPEVKFATIWAIYDGITMMSFGRHGRITEEYASEIENAILGYCRTFLPEVIALEPPRAQADSPIPDA